MPCMLLHDSFEQLDGWQDYVDNMLKDRLIETCAIYNLRGRILSTSDAEFILQDSEFTNILRAFQQPNNSVYKSLDFMGQHYCVVINDGCHGMLLKGGVRYASLCKTNKVVILALHKVNTDPEAVSAVTMNIGDYLLTKGM